MKIYIKCSNEIEDYKDYVIEKLDTGYSVYDSSGNEIASSLSSRYEARDYVDELKAADIDWSKYLYDDINDLKVLYKSFTNDKKKAFDEYMMYHLYADFLRYCSISLDDDNVIKQKFLFKQRPISVSAIHSAYDQFLNSTDYIAFNLYDLYVNTENTDTAVKYKIYLQNKLVQP